MTDTPAAMQDDALVERVARALSGYFGPEFADLPLDKAERRLLSRYRANTPDNTQADMIEAASAAIAAMPEIAALRADNDALLTKLTRAIDAADAILAPICAEVGKCLDPGYHVPDLVPELASYNVVLPSALFWELYQATDREALLAKGRAMQ